MNTEYIELENNQTIEKTDEMFDNGVWSQVPSFLVGEAYQRMVSVVLRRKKPTDESFLLSAALSSLEKAEKELDEVTEELSKQKYLNHQHLSILTHIGSMFGTRAHIDVNNELNENIVVELLPHLVERVIYNAELLARKMSKPIK